MKKKYLSVMIFAIMITSCLTFKPRYTQTALVVALDFKGAGILTPENIAAINDVTSALDMLPYINTVMSLTNVDYITAFDGGFEVYRLEDFTPDNEEELALFKEKMNSWDLYHNILYSPDMAWTSFILIFEDDVPSQKKIIADLTAIANSLNNEAFDFYMSDIKIFTDKYFARYFRNVATADNDGAIINKNFAGVHVINLRIAGTTPGDLAEPHILKQMDRLKEALIDVYPHIEKIVSFSDMIKRMNYVMHSDDEDPEHYNEIPYEIVKYPGAQSSDDLKRLVTQYLLLYTGSLDLYAGEDGLEPDYGRMLIFTKQSDQMVIKDIFRFIERYVAEHFDKTFTVYPDDTF